MKKVSLVKCTSYDEKEVFEAVKKSIDLIGGLPVKPNSKVLVKPNLLMAKEPDCHITTHPSVVKAIIKLLKEKNCKILVGDSGGIINTKHAGEKTGILKVCEEENVEFIEFTHKKTYFCKEALMVKRLELCDILDKVDCVVNLPKLKTHVMMDLTMAIKNTFGLIIGYGKSQMHFRLKDKQKFATMLVDINNFVKPCLNIMDGIFGMEGNGPGNGDIKEADIISASYDSLAMDITLSKVLGYDPMKIATNKVALTKKDKNFLEEIKVVGEKIEDVKVHFKPSHSVSITFMMPPFIAKFLNHVFTPRPIVNSSKCKACGECVRICPAKTISFKTKNEKKVAWINKKDCIHCYCCHEICPFDSIILKKGIILKIMEKLKGHKKD